MKRLIVGLAAMSFLAAASSAAAKTITVYAGPPGHGGGKKLIPSQILKLNPNVNAYFPSSVTINVGDSVNFVRGKMPHTIDLTGPTGQDLPLIVAGAPISGLKDAAGNPFWFNGQPSLGLNPELLKPIGATPYTYNGSSRVDSGFYTGSGTAPNFVVKFTKAGVYHYTCDVHYNMFGTVTVLPKGKPTPSAAQVAADVTKQGLVDVNALKKVYKTPKPPANTVSVGESGPGGVELFAMFPSTLTVKAGTTVKFQISKDSREEHTITFGPSIKFLDNLSNELLVSPGPTQEGLYPSDNPVPVVVTPTAHGNGFANVGVVSNDPTSGAPRAVYANFPVKGTYHYICLIHPFMQGTIIVK